MLSIFDNYEIVLSHLRNHRDGLTRLITWLEEIKAWNGRKRRTRHLYHHPSWRKSAVAAAAASSHATR